MDEQRRQELIERFLDQQMKKEERTAFESQLQTDAELADALQLEQMARQLVEEGGRANLRNKMDDFEAAWQQQAKKGKPLFFLSRTGWGIAAIALLLVAALLWLTQSPSSKPQTLYASHFEVYRPPSPERGEATLSTWQQATNAYTQANYAQAAALFQEDLKRPESIDYLNYFYIAMSQMAQKEAPLEPAIKALDQVLQSDNDYRQQAQWYKALALLRLERINEAAALLQEIQQGQQYKWQEAATILKAL